MNAYTLAYELEKAQAEHREVKFQEKMLVLIVKALISILEKLNVP